MKKSDQDKDNYRFTARWIDEHLPHGMNISTEQLYNDFIDRLIDIARKDEPSKKAFLCRLHKMDFVDSKTMYSYNLKGEMVHQSVWFKVVPKTEPCVFSKNYGKAMKLLAAGKERVTWWR